MKRFSFTTLASKIDLFAFVPQFRTSQREKGLSTGFGLSSTLVILVCSIIFFTQRLSTLVNHIGTNHQVVIEPDYYNPKEEWKFTIGQTDASTGFDF